MSPARAALAGVLLAGAAAHAQPVWTHFGRTPERAAVGAAAPASLGSPLWTRSTTSEGEPIAFVGQAGVVVDGARVYALGRVGGGSRLMAFGRDTGEPVWSAPVGAPVFNSWSAPAVDEGNGTVVAASGRAAIAFDAATGAQRWSVALERDVVNASPLVTSDLGPADRAFITDYDGFGAAGKLYCINVDPFDAQANPYAPGDVVWSVTLGATSGSTPAYADGVVYVASQTDESGWSAGVIRAFPAAATSAPAPLWAFENPAGEGFYGGVALERAGDGLWLYAASYSFVGGLLSGNLVKLDAATGSLVWSVPAGRTASTPVPLGDGRIVLSAGIHGFGSAPTVQLFEDLGATAGLVWDSAAETWIDADADGRMDAGEFLGVGGWTHLPAVSLTPAPVLIAGELPLNGYGPSTSLSLIDLSREPSDPAFIADGFAGAGSTPALADGRIYSVGPAGLHAFGPRGCAADCDGSGALTLGDFLCFRAAYVAGDLGADCDGSGSLTLNDFLCFRSSYVAGCP